MARTSLVKSFVVVILLGALYLAKNAQFAFNATTAMVQGSSSSSSSGATTTASPSHHNKYAAANLRTSTTTSMPQTIEPRSKPKVLEGSPDDEHFKDEEILEEDPVYASEPLPKDEDTLVPDGVSLSPEDLALRRLLLKVPYAKSSDVAIVTLQSGWHAHEWTNCTFKKPKVEYSAKHKYAFFDESTYPETYALRPHPWMYQKHKVGRFRKLQYLELILRARLPFKWLLWVDGDTAFLDHQYTVENRIETARSIMKKPQDHDPMFILATDFNGVYVCLLL
jgi:hypothetical protein